MGPRGFMQLGVAAALLVISMVVGLCVGTSSVGWELPLSQWDLVSAVRLPRVLLGAVAGAALAVSGVAFQAILRNPLADPYIAGVSGGAALGGVLALVLGLSSPFSLPVFAFLGAAVSTAVLFGAARRRGTADPLTLLLLGVIFNAFAAAVVTLVKTVVGAHKAQEILFWLMGAVQVESFTTILVAAVGTLFGVLVLQAMAGTLNLLTLGEDQATSLGLDVDWCRKLAFASGALLVGTVVASCGMIGFVGLVVPHVLRRIAAADHRLLVPISALGGASFLVLCDCLARLSFYFFGSEVPVGVITAFTGGPFFMALLLQRRGSTLAA